MYGVGMKFQKLEEIRTQLKKLGSDFVCKSPLPASSATVLFFGSFQEKIVLWCMNLTALKSQEMEDVADALGTSSRSLMCPFIEIIEGDEGIYSLNVGLDLKTIDEAVIKKTIIMIRNYKRLRIGRIEFGSMHT